jgi:hypothetical protein
MDNSKNLGRTESFLRVAVFVLNAAAVIMLILKLSFGNVTNDDLIVMVLVIFLGNVAIVFVRKQKRTGVGKN